MFVVSAMTASAMAIFGSAMRLVFGCWVLDAPSPVLKFFAVSAADNVRAGPLVTSEGPPDAWVSMVGPPDLPALTLVFGRSLHEHHVFFTLDDERALGAEDHLAVAAEAVTVD